MCYSADFPELVAAQTLTRDGADSWECGAVLWQAKVLAHQRAVEQRYTSQIFLQTSPHTPLPGFPLPCIPPLDVPNTQSSAALSFRLFPSPPAPPPPPPQPREEHPDALPYSPPVVATPALPGLSMTHARIEVLPSLGATPQVRQRLRSARVRAVCWKRQRLICMPCMYALYVCLV